MPCSISPQFHTNQGLEIHVIDGVAVVCSCQRISFSSFSRTCGSVLLYGWRRDSCIVNYRSIWQSWDSLRWSYCGPRTIIAKSFEVDWPIINGLRISSPYPASHRCGGGSCWTIDNTCARWGQDGLDGFRWLIPWPQCC